MEILTCGRRLTTRQGKEHNAAWAAICADRGGAACPQKSGAKAARMAFAHVPGMPMERDNPAGAHSVTILSSMGKAPLRSMASAAGFVPGDRERRFVP